MYEIAFCIIYVKISGNSCVSCKKKPQGILKRVYAITLLEKQVMYGASLKNLEDIYSFHYTLVETKFMNKLNNGSRL